MRTTGGSAPPWASARSPSRPSRPRLVVAPVASVNRLTKKATSTALSVGEDVRAVTVTHADDEFEDEALRRLKEQWRAWDPHMPLIVLHSPSRSLARPIVDYLRLVDDEDEHDQLIVLIAEMQLTHPWQRLLQNQRGAVLDHAIRKHTEVVIARLRFHVNA
jgi:hypothetical protein